MASPSPRPNFFIVGAPKCGTTSLYSYLKEHPEVFMPDKKEPHYFCTDFNKPPRLTEDQYLELFAPARSEKRIGEGSTWYIYSEEARRGIKAFDPEARIIIMLRNPVAMMYSLHAQRLWLARENIQDFEEALEAESDRKEGRRLPPYPFPIQLLFYRDCARYSTHISAYLDQFGADHVKVIIFEEFVRNTEDTYREICDFLGIDAQFRPEFAVHNSNKRLRSVRVRRFLRSERTKDVGRWFPRRVRRSFKGFLLDANTKRISRPPMSASLRERLEAEFQPEVEATSQVLGKDLSRWWGPQSKVPAGSAAAHELPGLP